MLSESAGDLDLESVGPDLADLERRAEPGAARTLSSLRSASGNCSNRCDASGCIPAPKRARICSALTASPACKPSIPTMPEPIHTPGDSPRSS